MSPQEWPYGYGYCCCGCGQKTTIATHTTTRTGRIKGQPCRYVVGHGPRTVPASEKFWRSVAIEPPDDCWIWQGSIKPNGYGVMWNGVSNIYVHRLSWELHFGPIPDNLLVCHTCDVRACVNPTHLWLGTDEDNLRDMREKGREGHGGAIGETNASARLTEAQVIEIRSLYTQGMTQVEIGKRFGSPQAHISAIVRRKIWKHIP